MTQRDTDTLGQAAELLRLARAAILDGGGG